MERATKIRLQKMLGADKEQMNEGSRSVAKAELSRVLREFFELVGEPVFELKQGVDGIEGTLTFRANRVKNFTTLP